MMITTALLVMDVMQQALKRLATHVLVQVWLNQCALLTVAMVTGSKASRHAMMVTQTMEMDVAQHVSLKKDMNAMVQIEDNKLVQQYSMMANVWLVKSNVTITTTHLVMDVTLLVMKKLATLVPVLV